MSLILSSRKILISFLVRQYPRRYQIASFDSSEIGSIFRSENSFAALMYEQLISLFSPIACLARDTSESNREGCTLKGSSLVRFPPSERRSSRAFISTRSDSSTTDSRYESPLAIAAACLVESLGTDSRVGAKLTSTIPSSKRS